MLLAVCGLLESICNVCCGLTAMKDRGMCASKIIFLGNFSVEIIFESWLFNLLRFA